MMQLRLTRRLIEHLDLDPCVFEEPRPASGALGNWLASQVSIAEVSGFIFLSESTLYSFWLPESGNPLENIFLIGLAGVLNIEGFNELDILRLLGDALPLDLSLNADKRFNVFLRTASAHFRLQLKREGGLDNASLAAAISRVNRCPCKELEGSTPAEVLGEVLRLPCQ